MCNLRWQAAERRRSRHGAIAQHVGKPQRLQRAPVTRPRDAVRLGERLPAIDPSGQLAALRPLRPSPLASPLADPRRPLASAGVRSRPCWSYTQDRSLEEPSRQRHIDCRVNQPNLGALALMPTAPFPSVRADPPAPSLRANAAAYASGRGGPAPLVLNALGGTGSPMPEGAYRPQRDALAHFGPVG